MASELRGRVFVSATALAFPAFLLGCKAVPRELVGETKQPLIADDLYGSGLPPKTLVFTFDDGPGDRTSELSTYLKNQGIPATFFQIGARLAATDLPNPLGFSVMPDVGTLLAQMESDGHLIGNHSTTHRDLVEDVLPTGGPNVVAELTQCDTDISQYVDHGHLLFRAPYGSYDADIWSALSPTAMNRYVGPIDWDMGWNNMNYPNTAADISCWQGAEYNSDGTLANGTGYLTTQQCATGYLNDINTVGSGIVLMHDPYSWANGDTVDMVEYMVPILQQEGYTWVRADQVPGIAALLDSPSCATTCATCDGPLPTDCTSCSSANTLSQGSCSACTVCPAGSYPASSCTGTADTDCAPCAPGTYADGPGLASCSSCAEGTYSAAGASSCTPCATGSYAAAGASSCVACGDCDDGNVCTSDTCDPTQGCTSEPIAGCTPDAGRGASAADAGHPADAAADGAPREPDAAPHESGASSRDASVSTTDAADVATWVGQADGGESVTHDDAGRRGSGMDSGRPKGHDAGRTGGKSAGEGTPAAEGVSAAAPAAPLDSAGCGVGGRGGGKEASGILAMLGVAVLCRRRRSVATTAR